VNSIFLRIYIGMLAALVLVGLLAVGSLQLVNILRHDHYREQLAQGTFRLMADNLAGMDAVERTRAIALWGRLLGTPLALESLLELPLDSRARGRLMRGQVLVESQKPSLIYSLVSEKERLVLTATVEQVSEQLARATLFLISDELRRYPAPEQRQRLAELLVDKGFSYPVHRRAMDQMELDADQRRRLVEGDTVMALMHGGDAIRVMAAQVETPWILELGPLYPLNSYPPQLLALFTVLGLTLLGLTLYALVRRLEYRLRVLEAAVTRIAAGRRGGRKATPNRGVGGRRPGASGPNRRSARAASGAKGSAPSPTSCARRWRARASVWRWWKIARTRCSAPGICRAWTTTSRNWI